MQENSVEVARLGVDVEMRRRGVASQLIKKLEKVIWKSFALHIPHVCHSCSHGLSVNLSTELNYTGCLVCQCNQPDGNGHLGTGVDDDPDK